MNFFLKNKKTIFLSMVFSFLLAPLMFAGAFEIRDTTTAIMGDFALEPAKFEIAIDSGASIVKILNILNRTEKQLDFKIEIEDFTGSQDPNQTVILQGDEIGPYSLKDYLIPEIDTFSLKPGQKMILPITISVPEYAEPGGLYGSVLVSSQASASGGMGATIISRLGALFFVNVNGEVQKEGKLTSFKKIDSEIGKVSFELLWTNTGNVHLNPFGSIKIFNLIGAQIDEVKVPAYFAMPDSVRYRKVEWDEGKLFGRYKALATINRGYDDIVDELELVFWVLSAKLLVTILGGIILFILIILWLIKTFDFSIIKQKQEAEETKNQNNQPDECSGSKGDEQDLL